MGALLSRALRPLKSFNIENRAHRVISKEKPQPAPRYPSTIEDIQRVEETVKNIDDILERKDPGLDDRLKNVYVTSQGRPEDDITREVRQQRINRPLPQNTKAVEEFDFGLKEPDKVPYGRTTLRQAIEYISSHQMNPQEVTAAKVAFEYKLKEEDAVNILKYFKTFEIFVPETKESKAVFAGPSTIKKRLAQQSIPKIEGEKSVDTLDQKSEKVKSA
ncbi:protein NDUFAF4 homolog [Leptidea sinapis]|uniref:protein NDUFAF4 homolog n=1 Tax=Leptidea sinapis TaxID=189913 RepID=UPI0021C377C7|nr:protein NDUFAF4 homolog [Leptidea sinapis]